MVNRFRHWYRDLASSRSLVDFSKGFQSLTVEQMLMMVDQKVSIGRWRRM